MENISGPKHGTQEGDPDRLLDCQEAMEDAFASLAANAVDAGWSVDEVLASLAGLVEAHIATVRENLKTTLAVGAARNRQVN